MAGRGKGGAGAGPSGSSQTQSQSFLPRLEERQGKSIFVMCVNKLRFEESLKVQNELGAVEETLYGC